ncbi:hypothetical protein MMPV_000159 [Pyropia vietnamensis]
MAPPVVLHRRWVAVAAVTAAAFIMTASGVDCASLPRVTTAIATTGVDGADTPSGGDPDGYTTAGALPAACPCVAAAHGAPYPPAGAVADGMGGWVVMSAGAPTADAPKRPPAPLPAQPLAGEAATAAPATVVVETPVPREMVTPLAQPPPLPIVVPAQPAQQTSPVFPVDPMVVQTPSPPPPAAAPAGAFPFPPTAAAPSAPVFSAGGPFVPPPRCPSFPPFNLYTSGSVTLTASEVLGPLACGGNANLTGFSINYNSSCDPSSGALALAVGGALTASSGQVVNGGISVGAPLPETVGQVCTRGVAAGEGVDFPRLTAAVTAASAVLCDGPAPVACVTRTDDGGGVVFDVSSAAAASLAVCTVPGQVLTAATGVTVVGRASETTVVAINVVGGDAAAGQPSVRLADCEFFGFTPTTTVLNFCGVATLTVDNVGVPAAVLAPAVALNGPSGHVQGSVVAAAVNTGIEFRNAPFLC